MVQVKTQHVMWGLDKHQGFDPATQKAWYLSWKKGRRVGPYSPSFWTWAPLRARSPRGISLISKKEKDKRKKVITSDFTSTPKHLSKFFQGSSLILGQNSMFISLHKHMIHVSIMPSLPSFFFLFCAYRRRGLKYYALVASQTNTHDHWSEFTFTHILSNFAIIMYTTYLFKVCIA